MNPPHAWRQGLAGSQPSSDSPASGETSPNLPDLHSAILNLPCHHSRGSSDAYSKGYAWGHRDARHAAAEVAASAQARITELEEALRGLLALDAAKVAFGYLDKGIGTATPNRAWLAARAALMEPKQ